MKFIIINVGKNIVFCFSIVFQGFQENHKEMRVHTLRHPIYEQQTESHQDNQKVDQKDLHESVSVQLERQDRNVSD